MIYLVHTSNSQLVALWLSFVCWTVTAATLGFSQWRAWQVADVSVITSGVAMVGVWRACFDSHTLVSPEYHIMFCRGMVVTQDFLPPEIKAAQVMIPVALLAGLVGNAAGIYALRNVYFGLGKGGPIRSAFTCAGAFCATSGLLSLVPTAWNLHSVLANATIAFPPEYHMPAAPVSQSVGQGIVVGTASSVLMVVSGLVFLSYRLPPMPMPLPPVVVVTVPAPVEARPGGGGGGRRDARTHVVSPMERLAAFRGGGAAAGKANLAFESHEGL